MRKFSVVAPRGQWVVVQGASEDCGACLVTLDQRAEDDGGDQGMNSTQPKIRYGRKAALRTSYGF